MSLENIIVIEMMLKKLFLATYLKTYSFFIDMENKFGVKFLKK